jgi:MbtH protein
MSNDRVDDITIDGDLFRILQNDEEQFSIWPAGKAVPAGWRPVGDPGSKDACLAHVDAKWTDMRPKSLRDAMDR